jgi:hypothetical protein
VCLGGVAIPARPSHQMIAVIPRSGAGSKLSDEDYEWLPRQCPACQQVCVIGHGRRRRQAHDSSHDRIRVRRGICKHCGRTLTVLPGWCVPQAIYSLTMRQETVGGLANGASAEQAPAECRDPNRIADANTVRRWIRRRLESFLFCAAVNWRRLCVPTLLVWDWRAALRILIADPKPP